MDPSFIKTLVRHLFAVTFSPADYIIEEGEQGNEVYFLASGHVDVLKGRRKIVGLSSGACFGEIALLVPNAARVASIVARSFCEAYSIRASNRRHAATPRHPSPSPACHLLPPPATSRSVLPRPATALRIASARPSHASRPRE